MLEELLDRFGEPPKSVQNLLNVAKLKSDAHRAYITEISQQGEAVRFRMFERAKIDAMKIDAFVKESKGNIRFVVESPPYFIYQNVRKNGKEKMDFIRLLEEIVEKISRLQ